MSKKEKRKRNVHVTALDGVVNVNSLFTIAIFVGLSMAEPGQLKSLNVRKECQPGANTAKLLVLFEILSFSFFLFSSLLAQSIKTSLNLKPPDQNNYGTYMDEGFLRIGVIITALSSVVGCLFLLVSMVYVIEMKLGVLSCKATSSIVSVVIMIPLTLAGIIIYVIAAITEYMHTPSVPDGAPA